jgi:ribonuclease P/MRP protein subunit POP5
MASPLKPLKPSLKEKKRYLVFEVMSNTNLSYEKVEAEIWKSCLGFLGEWGMAKAGMQVLSDCWKQASQRGIIRVTHTHTQHIRSALLLVKSIGGESAVIRTLGMSGIIDKAKKQFLETTL